MQATKCTAILLILALLTTTAADTAQTPAGDKADKSSAGAYTASCLVKITADPAVLPLNDETIDMLLRSSGVAGKAAREVLGLSPDAVSDFIEIFPISFTVDLSSPTVETTQARSPYGASNARSDGFSSIVVPAAAREVAPAAMSSIAFPVSSNARQSGSGDSSEVPSSSSPPRTPVQTRSGASSRTSRSGASSRTSRRGGGGYYGASPYGLVPGMTPSEPPSQEQTVICRLSVNMSERGNEVKPLAEEFMAALIENLRDTLTKAFNDSRSRLDAQFEASELEAKRAESELLGMQDQLRQMAGGRDLSRDGVANTISELNQQLQSLNMEEASYKALMDETTKRIAQTEKRVEEQLNTDTITDELERILKINEEQLKAMNEKFKAGVIPQENVAQATEKLARARIDLAKRRQELGRTAGGDLLASLNNQLAATVLDLAKCDAEMESLGKQLSEGEDLAARADEYELLSLKADIVRNGLQESLVWRDQLERRMRLLLPPAVSVIGGD